MYVCMYECMHACMYVCTVLLSLENKKLDNPLVVNLLHKLHSLSIAHKTIFS